MVYLAKSVGQAAGLGEHATDAQRDHARRLHAELQVTPCSPRCPVWLLYGVQPKGARHSMTPGRCKGKAHQAEHLGIAGRRVLVSRKWSNKTLDDHRAERGEFVRQLLEQAGIQPAHGVADGPYWWERPHPATVQQSAIKPRERGQEQRHGQRDPVIATRRGPIAP